MLVIKTQNSKHKEYKWVICEVAGKTFRLTAKHGDTKNSSGSAMLMIESDDKEIVFYREKLEVDGNQ